MYFFLGGEDDKGFVWRQDTGELVFECEGHKDSVISCGFSNDGKFVMTADMSGVVIVLQVDNHAKIWDFESVDLEWCKWHAVLNVLFAGSTDGELYMWKIPSGDTKMFQGHGSKSTVGTLSNNGKELFAGYEDGKLVYWDLKTSTSIFTTNGDNDSILCIDYQKSGNLVACGTREGKIKLYSSPAGKLVNTFLTSTAVSNETEQDEEEMLNSIESIAFSPNEQYLGSASLQGDLDIWDLNTQKRRHSCKHSAGITNMIWSPDLPELIITACLDGVIRIWKALSGELIKEIFGHKGSVLDMMLSYDNKHLLTAGDDQTARIFEI